MLNGLMILDSRCNTLITQYYKNIDSIADENISKFKSQMTSYKSLHNTNCVLLINNLSYIFIKYNDIIICAISNTNCNVFNVLSFEYKLIETIEQYNNCDEINAQFINENIVLILEILNEIIDDGYPQQMIHKPLNTLDISVTETTDLKKKKLKEVSTSITGCTPWRKCGIKYKMGWSVGGAKDINNFRHCINKQILPKLSSLTYNGIFYDYHFENINEKDMKNPSINKEEEEEGMNKLFYASYCYAKYDNNYYISVGLNSNLTSKEFKRNKLNLMIILDVSGSMNHCFELHNDMIDDEQTKIDIAKQCLIDLISTHIDNNDRLSILLFNSNVNILQQFQLFKDINKYKLIQKIKDIKAYGGTNLGNAYQIATVLFDSLKHINKDNTYDNRILYLTDAKSNLCYNECKQLIYLSKLYSLKSLKDGRIGTTFIGIGIDFNTDLVNKITSELYGANYYSVHSVKQFKKQMLNEFDLMISPLIFNLKLQIIHEGNNNNYYIDKIYGNGNSNNNNGNYRELMNVKTLFPSHSNTKNEIKGGIILIKICSDTILDEYNLNMELKVSYENRYGEIFENKQKILFKAYNRNKIYFDNNGIRKAVLLVTYVKLLKEWILSNNCFFVSKMYQKTFIKFMKHFRKEMKIINDNTLRKEINILNKLIETSTDYYKFDCFSLYRNHEILLLITEKLNVVINNKHSYDTKILLAECSGTIIMNSLLSGMPEIKMSINLPNDELRFHQCVRLAQFERDNIISFIPPDGKFELLNYKIDDIKNIHNQIPFDLIHNIKYGLNTIEFDITLQPKFDSHLIAKNVIIKIYIGTIAGIVTKNKIKCKYGKCELENEYLIWNIKLVHNERKPRLYGKLYLGKSLSCGMRYDKQLSEISVQFQMDNIISSCVKIMYLKVIEKSGYKVFTRVKYKTETDEVHNIKFKI